MGVVVEGLHFGLTVKEHFGEELVLRRYGFVLACSAHVSLKHVLDDVLNVEPFSGALAILPVHALPL